MPATPFEALTASTPAASRLTHPQSILAARRLHASVYQQLGYIGTQDLSDGVIDIAIDPWAPLSTYFAASSDDGVLWGVSRLIRYTPEQRLPALQHGLIASSIAALIAKHADSTAEVSALAIAPGAPRGTAVSLYEAMWRYGIEQHHRIWLMLIERRFRRLLHGLLGPVTQTIGPEDWYMGGRVAPDLLNTATTHQIIATHERNHPVTVQLGLSARFPHNPAWGVTQ